MANSEFEYKKLFEEFQRRKMTEKLRYFNPGRFPNFGRYCSAYRGRMLRFDGRITDTEMNEGRRIVIDLYPAGRGNDSEPQKVSELNVSFKDLARCDADSIEKIALGMFGCGVRTLCEYSILVDLSNKEKEGINYFIGKSNQKQRHFKAQRLKRIVG